MGDFGCVDRDQKGVEMGKVQGKKEWRSVGCNETTRERKVERRQAVKYRSIPGTMSGSVALVIF